MRLPQHRRDRRRAAGPRASPASTRTRSPTRSTSSSARYLAGEGASRAADLETGRQYDARLNAGDWDGLRPLVTEDFEVVDTRRLSWPTLGHEEFVEAHESYERSDRAAHVPAMRAPQWKCRPVDQREHRHRRRGRGVRMGVPHPRDVLRRPPHRAHGTVRRERLRDRARPPRRAGRIDARRRATSPESRTPRRAARAGSTKRCSPAGTRRQANSLPRRW